MLNLANFNTGCHGIGSHHVFLSHLIPVFWGVKTCFKERYQKVVWYVGSCPNAPETQTTTLKWMFGWNTISYVKIWFIIRLKQPFINGWRLKSRSLLKIVNFPTVNQGLVAGKIIGSGSRYIWPISRCWYWCAFEMEGYLFAFTVWSRRQRSSWRLGSSRSGFRGRSKGKGVIFEGKMRKQNTPRGLMWNVTRWAPTS